MVWPIIAYLQYGILDIIFDAISIHRNMQLARQVYCVLKTFCHIFSVFNFKKLYFSNSHPLKKKGQKATVLQSSLSP